MNEIAVYDPAVTERAMDAMTDRMITRINVNHDMLKIAHRIHLRETNLKHRIDVAEQRVYVAEKKLRHERKKAKIKERRNSLVISAVLGIAAWFARIAIENGLTTINFDLLLAFATIALISWTVCDWRHDSKRKKD